MAALPEDMLKSLPPERYRFPLDCAEQCWQKYPGSAAERLHRIAHPVNACNRNIVCASNLLLSIISG